MKNQHQKYMKKLYIARKIKKNMKLNDIVLGNN